MTASHSSLVRRSRAIALAAGLLAAAAVASAQEPPSTHVRYTRAEIQSPDGARVVYARIRAAAREVCGPADTRDLTAWSASRSCQEHAIEQAVASVHSERLAALYRHSAPPHG